MENTDFNCPILIIDDDKINNLQQFVIDLEETVNVCVVVEQDFTKALDVINQMKGNLKIIILDIMAQYDTLFGQKTFYGFNTGRILLHEIEKKLADGTWKNKVEILIRSARQDISQSDFKNDDKSKAVRFFRKGDQEIFDYIKLLLHP